MSNIIIYGIKNCNSMKKAFDFLNQHDIVYEFYDFKKEKLSIELLNDICKHISCDIIINTKGSTYKKLKEQGIKDFNLEIIAKNPSIIKRPLIIAYNDNKEISKICVGLQHMETLL